jgi:hypothetical protein
MSFGFGAGRTRMPEQSGSRDASVGVQKKLISFLLDSARRWPFVAGPGTLPPVAADA